MLRITAKAAWWSSWSPPGRCGSAAVLIVSMMFVFVLMAAFTVDYGYMQLVRVELRSATDAAAKAGAEALSRTQDPATARAEAVRYAAANTIGGKPFRLSTNDVVLGRVTASNSGRWDFQANASPFNAVQVSGRTGGNAAQPAIPLFFSGVVGKKSFAPSHQSTAGQQEVEICICLDRSGSMTFDMTGEDFSFAPDNPLLIKQKNYDWTWRNMLSPPHPTASRWAALEGAIDVYLSEVSKRAIPPRTALVTWGSQYTMPVKPYTEFADSTEEIALPAPGSFDWNSNAAAIRSRVASLGETAMMGGTNLSAGLDTAVAELKSSNAKRLSSKVVILLTDGEWNDGRDPMLSAYDARADGIIVHCVSMLTTSQPILQNIADTTGGRYWGTNNAKELRTAFAEIANSLPIVLTD